MTRFFHSVFVGVATLGCALGNFTALAEDRALLVAVSAYPEPRHRLNAPPNDAVLIWKGLRARGIETENVRVLVDQLPDDGAQITPVGLPTRAAIISELERLVRLSKPGDTVFLYFSGHGSQQPEASPASEEPDGLDEIFLPIDMGRWEDGQQAVENALVDDEISSYVKQMRTGGAFVWIVFDSCHSGTMTRSLESRRRGIDPLDLGVPQAALDAARARKRGQRTRGLRAAFDTGAPVAVRSDGGVVAFFAAQANEVTYETLFPRDYEAPGRRPQSLLSYFLSRALMSPSSTSYRRIAQQIRAGYDTLGAKAPTPLFEGELDRPVFGHGLSPQREWQVLRTRKGELFMAAGELNGARTGAQVSVFDVEDPAGEPIARATLVAVGLVESVLELQDAEPKRLPKRLLARFVGQPPARALRVALPVGDRHPKLDRALAPFSANGPAGPIVLVPANQPADLRIRREGGRLVIVWSGAVATSRGHNEAASISLDAPAKTVSASLAKALELAARTHNLLSLAAEFGGGPAADNLTIERRVLRGEKPAKGTSRKCKAPPVDRVPPGAKRFDPIDVPIMYHCDTVYAVVGNAGPNPIDVTVLFIDSAGALVALPQFKEGVRLEPRGKPHIVPIQVATWDWVAKAPSTVGLERLLIIGVERDQKEDLAFVVGFGYLADHRRVRTRSLARAVGPAGAFVDLLDSASFPTPRTRSLAASSVSPQGAMRVIRWHTRDAPPPGQG